MLNIGDYVRLKELIAIDTRQKLGRPTEGYITSIEGPYFRIENEKDGYREAHLEKCDSEYDAAIKILGEDYFA